MPKFPSKVHVINIRGKVLYGFGGGHGPSGPPVPTSLIQTFCFHITMLFRAQLVERAIKIHAQTHHLHCMQMSQLNPSASGYIFRFTFLSLSDIYIHTHIHTVHTYINFISMSNKFSILANWGRLIYK